MGPISAEEVQFSRAKARVQFAILTGKPEDVSDFDLRFIDEKLPHLSGGFLASSKRLAEEGAIRLHRHKDGTPYYVEYAKTDGTWPEDEEWK